MTTREAAEKWGVPLATISKWCKLGKVQAHKEPRKQCIGNAFVWVIPDDAPKPDMRKPPTPVDPTDPREYLKRYQNTKTYRQISDTTGVDIYTLRDMYDDMFLKGEL